MTPFFARALSLVVCSGLLVAAVTATAFGQAVARDSPRPPAAAVMMPPYILAAQTFLLTAYPDLAAQPLEITLKQIDGAVSVSVAFATEIRDAGPKEPVVTARFEYDAQTRLRRFEAKGSWLEDSRHDALRQQLLMNPRWADSDADVALTRAGAASTIGTSFGPAQPTSVAALELQVGVSRSNAPARFLWFQDANPGGPPSTTFRDRPVWVTEGVAVGPRGESFTYQFEYEPFNGRLVGVVRR